MRYCHVLIELAGNENKQKYALSDLSLKDLKKHFLSPYRKGKRIFWRNEVIDSLIINKVEIIMTEKDMATELDDYEKREWEAIRSANHDSSGVLLIGPVIARPEDVRNIGKDVTGEFIKGPPGETGIVEKIISFLNNQWVVTVLGGLLIAFLIWKLGWG